jgi:predicted RNA-binding protein
VTYWLIAETLQNWEYDRANGFRYFGLPEHKRGLAGRVSVGDLLIAYVTKASCFADVRRVTSNELITLKGNVGYDSPFPFAIQTQPVITPPGEKWLKAANMVQKLDMTKNLRSWSIAFRQSMRQLSEKDGALLKRCLEQRT